MKKNIFSHLFVFWFFISVGLSLYFGEQEQTKILVLVTIGQIFLVIGIFALIDVKKKQEELFWILIFPIIGLGMIVVGLGIFFHINIITKYYILLIPIGMIIVGILSLLDVILGYIKKDKTCTEKIIAKIVGVLEESEEEDKHLVYEFYYHNQCYLVSNARYYSKLKKEEIKEIPSQEQTIELVINPNDPYIWKNKERSIIIILLERIPFIICIIAGIIMFYIFSKYFI